MVTGVFSIPFDADFASSGEPFSSGAMLREFIAGQENAVVRTAAADLLSGDVNYNPLVLYGATGTGKSLLARGLVAKLANEQPSQKCLVVTGSDFARNFAAAIDADGVDDFRRRHRDVDVLLFENLHELANKTAAQRELTGTLDYLLSRQCRVLVTTHVFPSQLKKLAPALVSRLVGGMTIPVQQPSAGTRLAIIERLAERLKIKITDDAVHALSERLTANVPELNHALLQISSFTDPDKPVDLVAVNKFLAGGETSNRQKTLRDITTRVARFFQMKSTDLKGRSRRQPVALARSVAMHLARLHTSHSLQQIGKHFGGRDHTTVLHACRKIESALSGDASLRLAVEEISALL